jgi:hypothetical protein
MIRRYVIDWEAGGGGEAFIGGGRKEYAPRLMRKWGSGYFHFIMRKFI